MAEVELKEVVKRYGDVTAVRNVNLTIKDQEFVVLVGPSGCGKSTTLRMVAGLEEITEGDISIGGRRVNDVAPKDRDIAMVFQSYALYPHMTVFDNMAFGLKLQRLPKSDIEARVFEAADVLGLREYLDRRPKALSGGQRQRVAMGRAMVRQPAVFLFDEPLSNLDAKLRVQMRTEIARLHHQQKSTSLYVTHDQVEAMTLADRIVVMKDGVVQQVGSPMTLYHEPANLFVAQFIGSPSMNTLAGEVVSEGKEFSLRGEGFSYRLPSSLKPVLNRNKPGKVVLGVRPQGLTLEESQKEAHLPGLTLDVVEPLGAETFLHFQLNETQQIVVRENRHTVRKPGESFHLRFLEEGLHLFDSETGAVLT